MPTGTRRLGNLFGKDLSAINLLCEGCNTVKNVTEFRLVPRKRTAAPGLYINNAKCLLCDSKKERKRSRRKQDNLRAEVLDKFGNKCGKCGFDDHRALQLDHVKGGGRQEAKKLGDNRAVYRKALKDTTGAYQLLCANCNWIKRYENNEYRHKRPALTDCE